MPVFRRTGRRWLTLSGLLLSSLFLASCGDKTASILDTAGPIAADEANVFWAIFAIATFVFVAVEGALIYSIIRYRERPGAPNPRQIHGSMKLEVLWTAIPTVFLIVILLFTIRGLLNVAPEAKPIDDREVKVTAIGHQWWWEFYYPEHGFTTADSLVVPVGTVVDVQLYTNNVLHSFWVPQLTGKTDLVPGQKNSRWFKADKAGTYEGICAEFCGAQHANMRFNVIVQDYDTYMSWVSTQQKPAQRLAESTSEDEISPNKGQEIFEGKCTSCHGIVGLKEGSTTFENTVENCSVENPGAQGSKCPLGPNLTHFGSRNLIAGGVLEHNSAQCNPNDEDLFEKCNLAKWLMDPQGIKPGNKMNVQLTEDEVRALVAYLESLK